MANVENTMEIWIDIPGLEGKYQASSEGRLRSLDRFVNSKNGSRAFRKGMVIKAFKDHKGYYQLYMTALKKNMLVHQLVARAFIPNPNNYTEVNHINGIPADNRVENLEWSNRSLQMKHAYATGLREKYCHANERWSNRKNKAA